MSRLEEMLRRALPTPEETIEAFREAADAMERCIAEAKRER